MAKGTRICKVCGKEYEYCKTKSETARWVDVACCEEHATEYFKAIAISRGETKSISKTKKSTKKIVESEPIETIDDVKIEDSPIIDHDDSCPIE